MKKVCLILLLTSFLMLSFTCQKDPNLTFKYFRHIDFEGREPIIGKCEVEHDEAMSINCYMFTYDNDSLVSVEYFKESTLSKDPIFRVARIDISYEDDRSIRSYYDEKNDQIANSYGQFYDCRVFIDTNAVLTILFDKNLEPTADKFGVNQYLTYLNEDGLAHILFRLDNENNAKVDNSGFYASRFSYDGDSIISMFNCDENGKYVPIDESGTCVLLTKYDDNCNIIEFKLLDENKRLVHNEKTGYAIRQSSYDDKGNLLEDSLFNEKECLTYKVKYDNNENMVELASYDGKGNLKEIPEFGAAIVKYKYDEINREIEVKYYDALNKLTESITDGAAVIRTDYSVVHDTVIKEITYYNNHKELSKNANGYTIYREKHVIDKTYSEFSYLDRIGNLKEPKGYNYAKYTFTTYEDSGFTETCYYDYKNELINGIDGWNYAIMRYIHDKNDSMTCTQTFNKYKELVENPENGAAIMKYERDDNGKLLKTAGYDKNNKFVFEEVVDE